MTVVFFLLSKEIIKRNKILIIKNKISYNISYEIFCSHYIYLTFNKFENFWSQEKTYSSKYEMSQSMI